METFLLQAYLWVDKLVSSVGVFVPSTTQRAFWIILGVFLFALLFGFTRRHMLEWSIKGAWFGVLFGIIITLVVQAVLLIGGRTTLVELIGNEKTPKVVRELLFDTSAQLSGVLGKDIPVLSASDTSDTQTIFTEFNKLSSEEQSEVKEVICLPTP